MTKEGFAARCRGPHVWVHLGAQRHGRWVCGACGAPRPAGPPHEVGMYRVFDRHLDDQELAALHADPLVPMEGEVARGGSVYNAAYEAIRKAMQT